MSESEINAYLEKEIINCGRIVTYRRLSRKFSIHVNAAKNALSSFYESRRESKQPIYATFWLFGEPHAEMSNGRRDEIDVDRELSIDWLVHRVMVVGEEDLQRTEATFNKILAFHVYSLSLSPLNSASQLCCSTGEVREMDKAGGEDFAKRVGKFVSKQVKHSQPIQKISKAPALAKSQTSTPSAPKPEPKQPEPKQPEPKQVNQQKLKPSGSFASGQNKQKASGVLNWANAKPKDADKPTEPRAGRLAVKEEVKKEPVSNGKQKRGTKRKSDVMSRKEEEEEEEETLLPNAEVKPTVVPQVSAEDTTSIPRIKKGVILSDDEDAFLPSKSKNLLKGKQETAGESDTDRSVRAMMDIDDEYVVKASKRFPATPPEDVEEPPVTDHVDSAMDEDSDDPAPKVKRRKRKQKKVIPVGRNGLPKRRTVKSKTDFDEKEYTVTMDYSSYESVDEGEEIQEDQKTRPKIKAPAKKKQIKGEASALESEATLQSQGRVAADVASKKSESKKSSRRPSEGKERQTNGSQKSLASFFGSGGGKNKK